MTYRLLAIFALFFNTQNSFANNLFDEESLLSFDLVSNFDQIISDTKYIFPDRRTPQPATLRYSDKGNFATTSAMVRARGWDRLKQCEIPPLKLEIDKSSTDSENLFSGAKSLKLVTSCYKSNAQDKRRWAMREYIIYKLYQHVTPISYKVRPVYVTYKHNNGSLVWGWDSKDFGFLIENQSKMAKRNHLSKKEIPENTGMDWRRVDHLTYLKLSLFQFMLNNTDFGIVDNDMRNIDIVEDKSTGVMYPVPFDFDQAEFVRISKGFSQNTKRWESDKNLICFNWTSVSQVLPLFKSLKNVFLSEIDKYESLNFVNSYEAQILKAGIVNFYQMMDNGDLKYVVDRTWKKNDCR